MALILSPATAYLTYNSSQPFEGSGGTAPYTYAVVGGGAGGTINASTGVYVAPNSLGTDTIRVTDALAATATATVNIGTAEHMVCNIIEQELSLASGRVYLWDQKIFQPTDFGLFVVIGILSCKPFGNTLIYDDSVPGQMKEIQSTNFYANLSIDICSRGVEARDRKEEVIMALNSVYAEQQQELNSFKLGTLPTAFTNLSQVDGTAIPYRFNITVGLQYFIKKVKSISYYDTFLPPDLTTET